MVTSDTCAVMFIYYRSSLLLALSVDVQKKRPSTNYILVYCWSTCEIRVDLVAYYCVICHAWVWGGDLRSYLEKEIILPLWLHYGYQYGRYGDHSRRMIPSRRVIAKVFFVTNQYG